jgi:predicted Zn-dependent peptidase
MATAVLETTSKMEQAAELNPLDSFDRSVSFRLDNGLRVTVLPRPSSPSVGVKFYVGSGSQFETPAQHGLSHLIEHSLFKSTRRRSGAAIYRALEEVGGQINAFTHREYLALSAQFPRSAWRGVLELLAEVISQPAFDPHLIAEEKEVVIQEIARKQDNQSQIWDLLIEVIWEGGPFARTILGQIENVRALGINDIWDYYRQHFTAPNSAIAVVGDVEPTAVADVLNQALAEYPAQGVGAYEPQLTAVAPSSLPRTLKVQKYSQLTNVLLGWPTITQYDRPNHHRLKVLNRILGVGGASWLREEVREKHKLAYSIQSVSATYASRGYLAVLMGVPPANVEQAIELVQGQVARLQDVEALSEQTLAFSRNSYEGSLAVHFDDNLKLAEHLGLQSLMKVADSFAATVQEVRATRATDIRTLADRFLRSQPYIALLGR